MSRFGAFGGRSDFTPERGAADRGETETVDGSNAIVRSID
jgi:hypothetical protein